jgi:hypothetical protein
LWAGGRSAGPEFGRKLVSWAGFRPDVVLCYAIVHLKSVAPSRNHLEGLIAAGNLSSGQYCFRARNQSSGPDFDRKSVFARFRPDSSRDRHDKTGPGFWDTHSRSQDPHGQYRCLRNTCLSKTYESIGFGFTNVTKPYIYAVLRHPWPQAL